MHRSVASASVTLGVASINSINSANSTNSVNSINRKLHLDEMVVLADERKRATVLVCRVAVSRYNSILRR